MKQTITFIFLILGIAAFAQPCNGGRYASNIFTNVDVTSNIQYGQNLDLAGNNVNLLLDFYEPNGDTELERPLIIWLPGGSFLDANKENSDMVTFSTDFAEKGFVCASMSYRVGLNFPPDSASAIRALLRAVQDAKAAVRFFYKDRATTNTYKIDTTQIFLGGTSAGALTALHYAYLDQLCEVEHYLDITTLNSLGGMEGESGNPGYSTDIIGVMSGAGALASYGFMEPGDIPNASVHGDQDAIVPYNRDFASVSIFDIIMMDGSRMIHEQGNAIGVQSDLYTFYGGDHVPYVGNGALMDTTINFFRDFVIGVMGCTDNDLQPANAPLETSNLYLIPFCDLNTGEIVSEEKLKLYPNPSNGNFTVESISAGTLTIIDLTGKTVFENSFKKSIQVNLENMKGVFLVKFVDQDNNIRTSKLVID